MRNDAKNLYLNVFLKRPTVVRIVAGCSFETNTSLLLSIRAAWVKPRLSFTSS